MKRIKVMEGPDPNLEKTVETISNKIIDIILGQRSDAIIEALANVTAIYIKEYAKGAAEVGQPVPEDEIYMFLGGRIKYHLDTISFTSENKPN